MVSEITVPTHSNLSALLKAIFGPAWDSVPTAFGVVGPTQRIMACNRAMARALPCAALGDSAAAPPCWEQHVWGTDRVMCRDTDARSSCAVDPSHRCALIASQDICVNGAPTDYHLVVLVGPERKLASSAAAIGDVPALHASTGGASKAFDGPHGSSAPTSRAPSLSAREWDVVRGLMAHQSIPELGRALGISVHTVRSHLKAVFRKLKVHSQRELVRMLAAPRSSVSHQP